MNSMYQYYEEATKCLACLHDVDENETPKSIELEAQEWFTRGWTLQELIAPKDVIFHNRAWKIIGKRSDSIISEGICEATGIPREVLTGVSEPYKYSVAQRMSWAAYRRTTRGEDIAYCLFGLFDINLLPIYGEGARKAFLRLQEAIISSSTDMSVFAWVAADPRERLRGALAHSPTEFQWSANIIPTRLLGPSPVFTMTNRGLNITQKLTKRIEGHYFLPLNCASEFEPKEVLGIILERSTSDDQLYYRQHPEKLLPSSSSIAQNNDEVLLTSNETQIYIVRDERYMKKTTSTKRKERGHHDVSSRTMKSMSKRQALD